MKASAGDAIVAIATPPGRGGIGVVRLSFGAATRERSQALIAALCSPRGVRHDFALAPRHAMLVTLRDAQGEVIDRGIALWFPAPRSYTGEDVLELQVHGGPVVLRMLVARCIELGASLDVARLRLAEPGEFTRRAFLNDKLDLAQAEAVADLIEASTEAAAKSAQASLSGAFSAAVRELVDAVIALRALVEATLDFPEEEIDFLEQSDARGQLARIRDQLAALFERARHGALLRDGLKVVLIGAPNVGKSSLLNALAEAEVAIVTPIAGTTRDRISETIAIEGVALHVVDTAGIREFGAMGVTASDADTVERIGIARTWEEIARADVVLHLRDASAADADALEADRGIAARLPPGAARRIVVNKIDLTGEAARIERTADDERIYLSAKTGDGIALLRAELLAIAGWQATDQTGFLARERHLAALRSADTHLATASARAEEGDRALDLVAEELRLTQAALNTITGEFGADDLLGEIFGKFCIGK